MEEKSTKFTESHPSSCKTRPGSKTASRCFLKQWPPRRQRLRVLNSLLGVLWLALPLWKQVQPLAPAAPTRQDLGTYLDKAMAPQPLYLSGPMAQGHLMTSEIQDPEDEHARSAVLLRFPCEQHHKGITKWINDLWEKSNMPAYNKPVRIHCKADSVSARLVFETRAKCQDFVARYKDDGIPYTINSPCCCANTTIAVRQSKSFEDR